MPDYQFLNLSPLEFEELSRDLLQKHLKIHLESFAVGKDGGIDFRYSKNSNNEIIIQCKRFSDYRNLLASLKTEVEKAKKLAPQRYILTTSVDLTQNNKEEIRKLFEGLIIEDSDIIGRQDLNNLLGVFPEIEKNHFKLWLSSTNILERVLHSQVYNQSSFEEENIKNTIKIYVENESFSKALKIIQDKQYVIISGIPGIGKTTLARILVYHFLGNGFEEFIFLSDSIKEGYEIYNEDKKQVFLFDDFLGRNFLEQKLSNNEEQRIVKFIEKIRTSKNKILILTTREYIMRQAKQRYDVFENSDLEFAKCIIDLSQYTTMVRAKILYNHLFFSEIPVNHLEDILAKKTYRKIIDHRNYNPRLIQTITNPEVWREIKSDEFSTKVLEFLKYPDQIWKHVYENQISPLSQCVLANLMSAGAPILMEDLKVMVQNFAKSYALKYNISYSEIAFRKSIKELENTFIITKRDELNQLSVDYQNPSVQDFLVNYFKNLPDYVTDIIQSATFFNQLFSVFAIEEYYYIKGKLAQRTNRIILTETQRNIVINKLVTDFDYLNSSLLQSYAYRATMSTRVVKQSFSDYNKIALIMREFLLEDFPDLRSFISAKFGRIIVPEDLRGEDFSDYPNLLIEFINDHDCEGSEIVAKYFSQIESLDQLSNFELLDSSITDDYQDFIKYDEEFKTTINNLAYDYADGVDDEHLETTIDEIEDIVSRFDIDCEDALVRADERLERRKKEDEEEDYYQMMRYERDDTKISYVQDEVTVINNMFDSLRQTRE